MKPILIATIQEVSEDDINFFPHVKRNNNPEKIYSFYFAVMCCLYLYNVFETMLPKDERDDFSDNFFPLFQRLFENRLKANKRFEMGEAEGAAYDEINKKY